ncbi:hypothetical protein Cgig2_024132 [Carnegiea gigantea]|uniref:Uncharacterized protein n=1 Tax=Carnegiea gigantea TaxID=171969 RepID=A0A9Q1JV57_9CARY|nr:hypothetical protein Cgig2_024132 [Carnegiea gigantea]
MLGTTITSVLQLVLLLIFILMASLSSTTPLAASLMVALVMIFLVPEDANIPFIPPFLEPRQSQFSYGQTLHREVLVIDLLMQVQNYKKMQEWLISKLGEVGARERLTRAVYMFSVGTNDYPTLVLGINPLLITYTPSQYVDMVIGNITSVVTEIYKTGGRKLHS